MRLRHPDGSTVHLGYCTNVHPAEDLAGILAQLDTYARAGPRGARHATVLGLGPVAGRPGRRRAGRRPGAARAGCAPSSTRAGLEVVTLNGFPYAAFQAPVVKQRRLPPGLDRPRSACATPSTWPGCWPTCCPTTPPAARSPRCRWPGGNPWDAGRADAARRRARRARRRAGRRRSATPGAPIRVGLRAGARLRRREHRPGRRAARPAWTPTGSASASTWPTWPAPGRTRPRRCARLRAAGLPVVKVQVSAALRGRRPGRRGRGAAPLRRAALPAPDPQRRSPAADPADRRPADDLDAALDRALPGAVAGALPRAAARPARAAAALDPAGAARRAGRAARRPDRRLRPPRRRDVHLGRAAGRPAARHRRGARRRASPPSWPSPATNWSPSA